MGERRRLRRQVLKQRGEVIAEDRDPQLLLKHKGVGGAGHEPHGLAPEGADQHWKVLDHRSEKDQVQASSLLAQSGCHL